MTKKPQTKFVSLWSDNQSTKNIEAVDFTTVNVSSVDAVIINGTDIDLTSTLKADKS